MINNLVNAIGLEENTIARIEDIIISSPSMKYKKANHISSPKELFLMKEVQKDVELFLHFQNLNQQAIIIQKLFRRRRAIRKLAFVKKNYNKSKVSVFQDIVKREKKYILNLATIVSQFIMPLRITNDKQLKELSGELKIIFSNIEEILSIHQMFFNLIRTYSDKYWPQINWFGAMITEVAPHFKVYGTYVNNFKFARDTLTECMFNVKFSEFIDSKVESIGMDLNMLLSLPLNHMAGYELHIKNLLEALMVTNNGEEDDDYLSLLSALTLLTETNNSIRNALAKAENIAGVQRVRKLFPSDIHSNEIVESYLSKGGDVEVIKEFMVEIVVLKKSNPSIVILFNNSCLIGSQFSKSGMSNTYQHKYLYSLDVTKLQEDEADPLSFDIFVVNEEKSNYDNNKIVENSKYRIHLRDANSTKKLVNEIQTLIAKNQRDRSLNFFSFLNLKVGINLTIEK